MVVIYDEFLEDNLATVRVLRVRFTPEVVAISEDLNRDLVSQWGYADLD